MEQHIRENEPPEDEKTIRDVELSENDALHLKALTELEVKLDKMIKNYREYMTATLTFLSAEDLDRAKRKAILNQLRQFIEIAELVRRRLAVYNVMEGHISRVEVARLLGVHQATVARWVKSVEDAREKYPDMRWV
jgi:hypothetical protein